MAEAFLNADDIPALIINDGLLERLRHFHGNDQRRLRDNVVLDDKRHRPSRADLTALARAADLDNSRGAA